MSCENSKRVQTSHESQKKECGHDYKENCQCSGMEQKDQEPTGSVQTMRQKFEAPTQKTVESKKEKSKRESKDPDQRSGMEQQVFEPSGSVQVMRQKFEAPSKKEKSPGKSQIESSSYKEHEEIDKSGGPVQTMRQKFEGTSKQTADDQRSSQGALGSKAAQKGPETRGPVKEMRERYEALSDKPAQPQKGRISTKGGQAPETDAPCPTSEPSEQKPPRGTEGVKKIRKRPSFSCVLASTPRDDRGYPRHLTDKEPTGMDPEGLQLGVDYPQRKEPLVPQPEPEETVRDRMSPVMPTGAKQKIPNFQMEHYEDWYLENYQTVYEFQMLRIEILNMLKPYIRGIDVEAELPGETLASMLKNFIESTQQKFRKANLELSDMKETDISAQIHDHKDKALEAVEILEQQLESSKNRISELEGEIRGLKTELNAAERKIEFLQVANQELSGGSGYDQELVGHLEKKIAELEKKIAENLSSQYEDEISRIEKESYRQQQENRELSEQLIAMARQSIESEEQYMRELSDAEQKMELHSILNEAIYAFEEDEDKEPNSEDAGRFVVKWCKAIQAITLQHEEAIDEIKEKCIETRKERDELARQCAQLEAEAEMLSFHIEKNKQTVKSYLEQNKILSQEIDKINQEMKNKEDSYKMHTGSPTTPSEPSFSINPDPFGSLSFSPDRIPDRKFNLKTPPSLEFPPPSVSSSGEIKHSLSRISEEPPSKHPTEHSEFKYAWAFLPQSATGRPKSPHSGQTTERSKSPYSGQSTTRSSKSPYSGQSTTRSSKSPYSGQSTSEHSVIPYSGHIDQESSIPENFPPETPPRKSLPRQNKIELPPRTPPSFWGSGMPGWHSGMPAYFWEKFNKGNIDSQYSGPVFKRNRYSAQESPEQRGKYKRVFPREFKSDKPPKRDSFDTSYVPKPHYASQGGYHKDDSFHFEKPDLTKSPGKRQEAEFQKVTPRQACSERHQRDSLDESFVPRPHFASQGGYHKDDSFHFEKPDSFAHEDSSYCDDDSHSMNKTLSIKSPAREDPLQLNVQVKPGDICESPSREHVVCHIDVNVKEIEHPIYEEENLPKIHKRRFIGRSYCTPPLTPSRARDPREGTPKSAFTKRNRAIRNFFGAEPDILAKKPTRSNITMEWETEPSLHLPPGYVRDTPHRVWQDISATPVNESEEEDSL